jgi:hypothetical protein
MAQFDPVDFNCTTARAALLPNTDAARAPYFIEHSGKLFHIHFHLNNAFALAGCVMPNSDSEELRAELLNLLDKQLEVLELSTCVTLTDEEQRAPSILPSAVRRQQRRANLSQRPFLASFAPKSRTTRSPFFD